MKYDDLSFTMVGQDGLEYINDILMVVPNPKEIDQPYVVFTDYRLDTNDEFINQYGKLVYQKEEYFIETDISDEEIGYIKQASQDKIVKYVNDTIEDNIHG